MLSSGSPRLLGYCQSPVHLRSSSTRKGTLASVHSERHSVCVEHISTGKFPVMRLGSALSATIAALCATGAAHASELEVIEQELSSSFSVDLGGYAVDHKTLIIGVFFGQVYHSHIACLTLIFNHFPSFLIRLVNNFVMSCTSYLLFFGFRL